MLISEYKDQCDVPYLSTRATSWYNFIGLKLAPCVHLAMTIWTVSGELCAIYLKPVWLDHFPIRHSLSIAQRYISHTIWCALKSSKFSKCWILILLNKYTSYMYGVYVLQNLIMHCICYTEFSLFIFIVSTNSKRVFKSNSLPTNNAVNFTIPFHVIYF